MTVQTFPLLWCERCGHAQEPPVVPELPDFAVRPDTPLFCRDCDEPLALLSCSLHEASEVWQAGGRGNGGMVRHVATIGALEALGRRR